MPRATTPSLCAAGAFGAWLSLAACGATEQGSEVADGTSDGATDGNTSAGGGDFGTTSGAPTTGSDEGPSTGGTGEANVGVASTTWPMLPPAMGMTFTGDPICVDLLTHYQDCGILAAGDYECPETLDDWLAPCYETCLTQASCEALRYLACEVDPASTTWDSVSKCLLECQGAELFTCPTGEDAKRCDFIEHCPDGSDEANCPEWTCNDGSVIPVQGVCNGPSNCPMGEDEADCGDFYMDCPNDRITVPRYRRCDGNRDCAGGEDEVDCMPRVASTCAE